MNRMTRKKMDLNARIINKSMISLDTSLVCERGRVLALVGPSGSGKTTILHCIAGLFKPDEGIIECADNTWYDSARKINKSPQDRRAGLVFQHYELFPHLTVLGNIMLPMKVYGQDKARREALALLEKVHLKGLENRYPAMLSGGQRQRVALARALARNPDVLLLDEPFSAVDQVTRRKLRLETAGLTRTLNIPIILVTHDLDEACMLADNLCVLHNGNTLQSGSVQEVMKKPANSTVARLIDIRNLFTGRVYSHDKQNNSTIIRWNNHMIEAPYSDQFAVDQELYWCIAASDIMLHRRLNPSKGEKENPVRARIREQIIINGIASIILELPEEPGVRLHLDVPQHVANRNTLAVDEMIGVSLLKHAIHLMED